MGNQWGNIYLCVPPTKMLGKRVPSVPPIIAAPASNIKLILVVACISFDRRPAPSTPSIRIVTTQGTIQVYETFHCRLRVATLPVPVPFVMDATAIWHLTTETGLYWRPATTSHTHTLETQ